jgi:hypothetical protein
MNTKLTLSIEQMIIEKAKAYARKKERSLSDLVENYLKTLISQDQESEKEYSNVVSLLKGSFTLAKEIDYKEELVEQLSKKYV